MNYIKISLLIILCSVACHAQNITWNVTTQNARWQLHNDLKLQHYKKESNDNLVEVFPSRSLQIVEGFGGSISEKGYHAMLALDAYKREQVLRDLFDTTYGANLSGIYLPIGSNDYAEAFYSLNDSISDYSMKYFSIARDKKTFIPFIKAASSHRKDLIIYVSPWSPPAWMKYNNRLSCNLNPSLALSENHIEILKLYYDLNSIVDDSTTLKSYALYLLKFMTQYKEEGIDIHRLIFQNESVGCSKYPGAIWSEEVLVNLIKTYLLPTFKNKVHTELWLSISDQNMDYFKSMFEDKYLSQGIKGFCNQQSVVKKLSDLSSFAPAKPIIQMHQEEGDGSNDWDQTEKLFVQIKKYFENGAHSFMYQNMMLDETGEGLLSIKQNSLITVYTKPKNVIYNPDFYLMKHLSYYLNKGAHFIKTEGPFSHAMAFQNLDGGIVVTAINHTDIPKTVKLKLENKAVKVILPSHSFNTFNIMAKTARRND